MSNTEVLLSVCVLLTCLLPTLTFEGCTVSYGTRGCSERNHNGVIVSCNGNFEVTEIPTAVPNNAVLITLFNFDFDHLERANFTKFKALECLNIFNSKIGYIEHDTFADTSMLYDLDIRGTQLNSLAFMTDSTFTAAHVAVSESTAVQELDLNAQTGSPLERMESLRLVNNSITEVSANILERLDAITTLSLSGNQIASLDWRKMAELLNLNELHLDNNNIQTLPEDAARVFYTVNKLQLANNPLHCNCEIVWLKGFYDSAREKTLDYDNVRCASPFKGRLRDTSGGKLTCTGPTTPVITWLELDDGRLAVNCSSDGDPAPTIRMILPGDKEMSTHPSHDLSRTRTSSNFVLTEPGQLTCIASNSEGANEVVQFSPGWDEGNAHQLHAMMSLLLTTVILSLWNTT